MTIDNLRAARRDRPSRPFAIRTGSGESHPVRQPETMSVPPDVSVLVGMPGPGPGAMIGVASVTGTTYDYNAAANRS